MAGTPSDDMEHHPSSSTVSITVLSVEPVKFGRIFALASAEVDIDGVPIVIHGVRAIRVHPIGTWIDLPRFRDENGAWRNAITLSDEISGPIGRAVPDEFVERGLAVREVRRFERRSPSSVLKAQNLLWEIRLACATAVVSMAKLSPIAATYGCPGLKTRRLRKERATCCSPLTDAPPGISWACCA